MLFSVKGGGEISKKQNINQSKNCTEGRISACWAGIWILTDAVTCEKSHWASKLGFVLVLQWGQSNWALYTNKRSDQRTSHCSVSMTLVNLWRFYFYFCCCWEVEMQAGLFGHYSLQASLFECVRFFFFELYFKVNLLKASDFAHFQLRLFVLI